MIYHWPKVMVICTADHCHIASCQRGMSSAHRCSPSPHLEMWYHCYQPGQADRRLLCLHYELLSMATHNGYEILWFEDKLAWMIYVGLAECEIIALLYDVRKHQRSDDFYQTNEPWQFRWDTQVLLDYNLPYWQAKLNLSTANLLWLWRKNYKNKH